MLEQEKLDLWELNRITIKLCDTSYALFIKLINQWVSNETAILIVREGGWPFFLLQHLESDGEKPFPDTCMLTFSPPFGATSNVLLFPPTKVSISTFFLNRDRDCLLSACHRVKSQ